MELGAYGLLTVGLLIYGQFIIMRCRYFVNKRQSLVVIDQYPPPGGDNEDLHMTQPTKNYNALDSHDPLLPADD